MVQTSPIQSRDSHYKYLPKSFLFISQHFCDCHQLKQKQKDSMPFVAPFTQKSGICVWLTFLNCSVASGSVFLSGWRWRESWRKARRISALLADCDRVRVCVESLLVKKGGRERVHCTLSQWKQDNWTSSSLEVLACEWYVYWTSSYVSIVYFAGHQGSSQSGHCTKTGFSSFKFPTCDWL